MPSQTSQQSIRASCDRCRNKKLGCTVSATEKSRTGAQRCDRCIRAKLDCVFSRRAPTRKTSDARRANGNSTRSKSLWTSETSGLPTPTEISSSLGSSDSLSGLTDLSMLSSTGEHIGTDFLSVSDHVVDPSINSFFNEELFIRPHSSTSFFDLSSFPLMAENTCGPTASLHDSSPRNTLSSTDEPVSPSCFVHLSGLVAEIHETINVLNGELRHPILRGAEEDLDTYSIGPILQLTRRFSAILRDWAPGTIHDLQQRSRADSSSPPLFPVSPNSTDFSSVTQAQLPPSGHSGQESISLAMPDMPTNLLMLTCYASLVKLYMMVLSQIRNHLRRLPASSSHHCTPANAQAEGQLQPEELFPFTNEYYSKIYTVVQMLLDEFQSMEYFLCYPNPHDSVSRQMERENNQPGEVQQQLEADLRINSGWFADQVEMIRAPLNQGASRMFGNGSQGLEGVVQRCHHLKAILRERMEL
ncbi:hypothetical protein N7507_008961 [Penicillium longicatenatum]|nr:hypothetical protein N7507_008961 [Penicillium longicatenatum]